MYNPQETYSRIKHLIKIRKTSIGAVNEYADLSENTISQSAKGQEGMKARNLYLIANFLKCSVDYLLGRTNDPNFYEIASITVGDISGNQNLIGGSHSNVSLNANNITSQEAALLNHFHSLDETKKAKVLLYAAELAEEK